MKVLPIKTGAKLGFLALALALACVAVWSHQIQQVDIPEDRTAFVVVFLAAAGLGVAALVKGAGWVGGAASVVAILIGLFLPFTVAISRQQVAIGAVQVGDALPHFTGLDEHEQVFDSESLRGHPVLIKFFRAHW